MVMDSARPQALNLPQLAPHRPAGLKFLSLCKMRRGTCPGCWVVTEDSREGSSRPAVARVPRRPSLGKSRGGGGEGYGVWSGESPRDWTFQRAGWHLVL